MRAIQNQVNEFFYRYLNNTIIYRFLGDFSDFISFSVEVFSGLSRIRGAHLDAFLRVVINQIKFTGRKALPLVSFISLIIGGTTIIQSMTFLPKLGQQDFIGNLLKMVIVREVGPLITAIIVLVRSGSAIASELATQKLHREVEAIELMGINPYILWILPRVVGGFISIGLLIIYFDFVAFIGGYLLSNFVVNIPFGIFIETIIQSISYLDILSSMVKMGTYGIMIPLICSYYGFKPRTLFEVPIFVSKAVVRSLLYIFVWDGIISILFYF